MQTLNDLKQDFTFFSKMQYKDKRLRGWMGKRIGAISFTDEVMIGALADVQRRVAHQKKHLARLHRAITEMSSKG